MNETTVQNLELTINSLKLEIERERQTVKSWQMITAGVFILGAILFFTLK